MSDEPKVLQVRCPHCHNPIQLVDDSPLSDIECPSCGSHFSLIGTQSTAAHYPHGAKTIAHFELIEQVGVGQFGSVWKARDTQLDRIVALKIPRKGPLEGPEAEQFLREARAAAQVRHSNIVSVHEVGREDESIYIVSDFIEGANLSEWLSGQKVSPREAAELCAKLADALHEAHEAGVTHRDLKPSNIMLSGDGEPYITDFGLAKRETGEITMTMDGRVLGTPAYMSPEQARGEAHRADRRTDVYSLGVILFQLLTGELPFRGETRMLIVQILRDEALSLRKLNSRVPRDLETICLKCLEKEADRRYSTASELSDDLRRFMSKEPIQARPITRVERAWRWCKRNPVVAGLVAAFAVAVVSGLLGVTWQWLRAEGEADRATQIAEDREEAWHKAEDEAEKNRRLLYISDMNVAMQAWNDANIERFEDLLRRHIPKHDQEDLRGFDWYHLWQLAEPARQADTYNQPGRARRIAVSLKKNLLAAGCGNGYVCVWDLSSGQELHRFRGLQHTYPIVGLRGWAWVSVAFSPDGATLAFPSLDFRQVVLQPLPDGEPETLEGAAGHLFCMVFSPDGRLLATGRDDGSVGLWDLHSRTRRSFGADSKRVEWLAFSPDSSQLASAGASGLVAIWDANALEELMEFPGHHGKSWCVEFSRDGGFLASSGEDNNVRVWELTGPEPTEVSTLTGHQDQVRSLAFSPDGSLLGSASKDNTAILWDAATWQQIGPTLKGHSFNVETAQFWIDGQTPRLLTGSSDGTVKCWRANREQSNPALLECEATKIALSSDDETLAIQHADSGTVTLWNLLTGRSQAISCTSDGPVSALAISSNYLAVARAGEVQLRRVNGWRQEGEPLKSQSTALIRALEFSSDGDALAAGNIDGHVMAWDVRSRDRLFEVSGHEGVSGIVCFTRNGEKLASSGVDGTVKVWDVRTGTLMNTIDSVGEWVQSLAFSQDDEHLASGTLAKEVVLWRNWDKPSCQRDIVLVGHGAGTTSIVFPRQNRHTLITTSGDRTVRVWDLRDR